MKEKEKELNVKNDKPDIKNKYYELGWFSTKINTITINSLKDICDWIEDMCELAKTGWKRQIWGAKKKDDRGVIGILNVCQKNNEFQKVKNLPNGIFDCVNLKNLLDKIKKCMENTNRGRTKQPGFTKSYNNCIDFLKKLKALIHDAGNNLQSFAKRLDIPKVNNDDTMYKLGNYVYKFGESCETTNISNYKKYADLTFQFFETIINSKKIEVGVNPRTGNWLELAKEKIDYLYTNKNYWIIKEILGDYLAKALENNCKKIFEDLTNKTIKLEQIKKNDKDDDDDDE